MTSESSINNKTYELAVVLPVYNEGKVIEKTLEELERNISVSHELIVVYDFGEDTTLPILDELRNQYKNLKVIKNNVAQGPSGAIRTGLTSATAPYILVTMADLCDDVTQINTMLNLAKEKADIICPSRYCKGGEQQLKESPKKWVPRWAGFLLQLLTGIQTLDPTNSFKLYKAEIFKRIKLKSTVSFSVTLEIVAKAHCLGYRILEIPTVWKDREVGKSNFKFVRSLFTYLPWFGVAMLRGRFIRFPDQKLNKMFSKEETLSEVEIENVKDQPCREVTT